MPTFARVNVVENSFLYCIIMKWNSLPKHMVNQTIQIPFLIHAKCTSQRIGILCLFFSIYIVSTSLLLNVFSMMMMIIIMIMMMMRMMMMTHYSKK